MSNNQMDAIVKNKNIALSKQILGNIKKIAPELSNPVQFMHICGTHEYAIVKNGLPPIEIRVES